MYSKWLNSSIWAIDGPLTSTTTPGQSEPESNGWCGASPSDSLVSYPGYLGVGGGFYSSPGMHSVYSTAPTQSINLKLNKTKLDKQNGRKLNIINVRNNSLLFVQNHLLLSSSSYAID